MVFEKIERVAIAVKDLRRAKDFFSSLLDIHFDECLEEKNLKLQASYSSFGLELVQATDSNTLVDKFISNRGEGVFCIVIKVHNLDDAVKEFKEMGMEPAGRLQFGGLEEIAFHPKDSFGVQIVLSEYRERHAATVAAMENS